MRITKDEAYILAYALSEAKYEINNFVGRPDFPVFEALTKLQEKLAEFGKDERKKEKKVIKSHNSYRDIIKRYLNKP